jgi:hypothetical protein
MRKNLPLLLVILSYTLSCSKPYPQYVASVQQTVPVFIKDAGQILFKVVHVSPTEVRVLFNYPSTRVLKNLILKHDTAVLNSYPVNRDGADFYSAIVPYNFDSTLKYDFKVQTNPVSDTIYQYTVANYIHTFRSVYTYRRVLKFNQSLGFSGFDITPSRNFLFLVDDSLNTLITKKMSLQNYAVENLSTSLYPIPVRAVSDSSILLQTRFYDNRYLQSDSSALTNYNIISGTSKFVDWVSGDYGRTSRIINNHVLVTNPWLTNGNSSLINLADNSKIVYGNSVANPLLIKENNFDNIYNGNLLVNIQSGAFTTPLPANTKEEVAYVDNAGKWAITTSYTQFSSGGTDNYSSHFSVYNSNQNKVYEGTELTGRIFYFPAIQTIKNNTILFYQSFGFGTAFDIDGYYTLDLNTKKETFIQSDNSSPYILIDFQLDEKRLLSIRYDGVYELMKK